MLEAHFLCERSRVLDFDAVPLDIAENQGYRLKVFRPGDPEKSGGVEASAEQDEGFFPWLRRHGIIKAKGRLRWSFENLRHLLVAFQTPPTASNCCDGDPTRP